MFDHLVYLVADLNEAVRWFSDRGIPVSPGGRHLTRGTHNALVRLGPRSYLELLAVDPDTHISAPRWMGIDLPAPLPRISRWAVHAGAKITEQARLLGSHPEVQAGERRLPSGKTLRWRLSDPGTAPAVDVLPFLIDWGGPEAPHPTDALPEVGVELETLRLLHPDPGAVNGVLPQLGLTQKAVRAATPKIEAVLHGRLGKLTL